MSRSCFLRFYHGRYRFSEVPHLVSALMTAATAAMMMVTASAMLMMAAAAALMVMITMMIALYIGIIQQISGN